MSALTGKDTFALLGEADSTSSKWTFIFGKLVGYRNQKPVINIISAKNCWHAVSVPYSLHPFPSSDGWKRTMPGHPYLWLSHRTVRVNSQKDGQALSVSLQPPVSKQQLFLEVGRLVSVSPHCRVHSLLSLAPSSWFSYVAQGKSAQTLHLKAHPAPP